MFKLHESCIARHLNERTARTLDDQDSGGDDKEEIVVEEDEQREIELLEKVVDSAKLDKNQSANVEPTKKKEFKEKGNPKNKGEDEEGRKSLLSSLGFGIDSTSIANDLKSSQDSQQEEGEQSKSGDTGENKEKKKKITAKEKRQLKKGSTAPLQNNQKEQEPENLQKQIPRGKKGKMKKIKQKYADQDEEEKNLKMEILGTIKKQKEKEKEEIKEAVATSEGTENKVLAKRCYKCGEEGHLSFACDVQTDEQKEDNLKEEEKEEIRRIMQEENIQELEDEDKEKLTELDSLTAKPLPDDIFLFAIPVCAPYTAMNNFKYRVKLTPGNTKKGKATKAALGKFLASTEDITQQEKNLLKNVPDDEMIMHMIGGVKLQSTG